MAAYICVMWLCYLMHFIHGRVVVVWILSIRHTAMLFLIYSVITGVLMCVMGHKRPIVDLRWHESLGGSTCSKKDKSSKNSDTNECLVLTILILYIQNE